MGRVIGLVLGLLALDVFAGCRADSITQLPTYLPPTPYGSLPSTTIAYQAYGDSITAGFGLPDSTLAYPHLLAADFHLLLSNYAISGEQACDVANHQIFPHRDDSIPGPSTLYSLLVGTNDAGVKGLGPYENVFTLCHRADLAWLGLSPDRKVTATAPTVLTNGAGFVETSHNWNAWETSSAGASITFPISLRASGPIYIWPRIIDRDPGAFSYAIDGATIGTFTTETYPAIETQNGTVDSLGFIRIPEVAAGTHAVTLTQVSVGGTMRIVGIGAPTASDSARPVLLLGNVPLEETGHAVCGRTPSICIQYTTLVISDLSLFAGDGLDVRYADNYPYMHASPYEMLDPVHPNTQGQRELRNAFATAIPES